MNWYTIALFAHVVSMVIWIGGVVFLDLLLVPALRRAMPDPEGRSKLLYTLFRNFFAIVWITVGMLLVSGYGLIHLRGDMDALMSGDWRAMLSAAQWTMVGLGHVMVVLALYVFFVPFLRMRGAMRREDWNWALVQADRIRTLSMANIAIAVPVIASGIWAIFGGPLY